MKKNIEIKLNSETSKVYLPTDIIGVKKENLQGMIKFEFNDKFINGIGRLEIEKNNNKTYIQTTKVGESYTVPILSSLLDCDYIEMQLVITEAENEQGIPIYKSKIFGLKVLDSINAIEEEPEDYPEWIDTANSKLAQIEDSIEEVETLDINASKFGKNTKVTITKKDGTIKEVEIKDGEQGIQGQTGNDGYTPVKGTDYWTTEDKTEIVNTVKSEIEIPVVPTDEINANTNARHTHSNKSVLDTINQEKITEWNSKQDAITDLETIRSKANSALQEHQSLKTINNQSIVGTGNITIEGGGASDYSGLSNKPKINNVELTGNKTLTDLGINNFSGNYNDLSNKPTIPTKTSQLTNDSGFLMQHQDISGKQDKSTLETDVKSFIDAEYIQSILPNAEEVEF